MTGLAPEADILSARFEPAPSDRLNAGQEFTDF
jgi:hypothetical protein